MLNFERLTLDDIDKLRPFFLKSPGRICDYTVGGTFMWRDFFDTHFDIQEGSLFIKVSYVDGKTAFTIPLGDRERAFCKIEEYCRGTGVPLRYCMVPDADVELLRRRYGEIAVYSAREWCDYLYLSEDIKNLPGRKYSGQRNHINKFRRSYPDWSFKALEGESIGEAKSFLLDYFERYGKDSETYDEGNEKTIEILDSFDDYSLQGGALYAGGRMIGCAVGETICDTLFVHSEKCLRDYAGAYQMLVNCFANEFATEGIAYINREEDDGDEGLRTSKLSYHPVRLIEKYTVCVGVPKC